VKIFSLSHNSVRKANEFDKVLQSWLKAVPGAQEADVGNSSADLEGFKKLNFCEKISAEDVQILFDLYDLNKDKSVSWKEFLVMSASIHQGATKMPLLESAHVIKLDHQELEEIKKDWLKVVKADDTKGTSVGFAQFKQLMQNLPDKDLKAIYTLYDQDHSGSISWTEYICVIVRLMTGSVQEKVRLVFDAIDEDGNSQLSKEEVKTAIKKFNQDGIADSTQFVDNLFKIYDVNKDKKISFLEFMEFVKKDPNAFALLVGTFNPLAQ